MATTRQMRERRGNREDLSLEEVRQKHTPKLMNDDNVGGVGLGRTEDGEAAVVVYTNDDEDGSESNLDGHPVRKQKRDLIDKGQLIQS